jgi:hypothetical protein
MSHAPSNFRRTDVKRAVQAVIDAGQKVSGIKFEKDGFTILTGPTLPEDGKPVNDDASEWDTKYGSN